MGFVCNRWSGACRVTGVLEEKGKEQESRSFSQS